MLDFSGKSHAGYIKVGNTFVPPAGKKDYLSNQRSMDHRDISEIYPSDSGWESMIGFMNNVGAIRNKPGIGFEANTIPTDKQLSTIVSSHTSKYRGEPLTVELSHPTTGDILFSKDFQKPNIESIKNWMNDNAQNYPDLKLAPKFKRGGAVMNKVNISNNNAKKAVKLALDLAKESLKKKNRKHFEDGGPDHESETKDAETKDTSDTDQKDISVEQGPQEEKQVEQVKEENQPSMVDRALGLASNAASAIGNFAVSPAEAATPDTSGANSPFANPNFTGYPSTDTSYLFGPASPSNPPLTGPITTAAGMSTPQLDAANAQYVENQQLQDAIQAQADAAENAAMNANNALLMRAGPITGLGGTPNVTSPDQRLIDAALSRTGPLTGGDSGTALNAALSRTGPLTGGDSGTALNAALSRTGPLTGGDSGTALNAALSRTGPLTGGDSGTALNAALSRTGPFTGGNTGTSIDAALSRTGPMTGDTSSSGAGPSDAALRLARDTITQNLGGTGGGAAVTGGGGTAPTFPGNNVPTPPIPVRDLQGPDIAEKVAGLFGLSTQQQLDKFYKQYTDQGLSETDAYNKAIGDIQTMRANAKPGPFDKRGYVAPDIVTPQIPVSPTDTTPATASTAFKLPGVNQPYVPPNAQASSTGTGYADLGANASVLRQAQYTQAIKNALLLANGNQYYG